MLRSSGNALAYAESWRGTWSAADSLVSSVAKSRRGRRRYRRRGAGSGCSRVIPGTTQGCDSSGLGAARLPWHQTPSGRQPCPPQSGRQPNRMSPRPVSRRAFAAQHGWVTLGQRTPPLRKTRCPQLLAHERIDGIAIRRDHYAGVGGRQFSRAGCVARTWKGEKCDSPSATIFKT